MTIEITIPQSESHKLPALRERAHRDFPSARVEAAYEPWEGWSIDGMDELEGATLLAALQNVALDDETTTADVIAQNAEACALVAKEQGAHDTCPILPGDIECLRDALHRKPTSDEIKEMERLMRIDLPAEADNASGDLICIFEAGNGFPQVGDELVDEEGLVVWVILSIESRIQTEQWKSNWILARAEVLRDAEEGEEGFPCSWGLETEED